MIDFIITIGSYRLLAFLSGQLLALLIFACLVASLFKNTKVAIAWSFIVAIFWVLELSAVYLSGQLIDYRYYLHFNLNNAIELFYFFPFKAFSFVLLFLFLWYSIFKFGKMLRNTATFLTKYTVFAIIACFLWMCRHKAVIPSLTNIAKVLNTKVYPFDKSLSMLGIDPNSYVYPQNVKAKSGKNIIVLVLESMETGLLEKHLKHLTPTLQQYASEWTYLPMEQQEASSWTAGSIYTVLTGMPAYFRLGSNQIFQNTNSVQITGLPHILKKANYDINYFIARPEFAGMEDLFSAYKLPIQSEKTFKPDYPKFKFGMHDKDLFYEFEKALLNRKNPEQPFAYFLSSVSTHFPDGIYDKRMEAKIGKQKSNLEFMIKATDFYIKELLKTLEKKEILDNTAVYIFPDHTLMGSTARVLQELESKRGLYVITNVNKDSLQLTSDSLFQIDLPKLILNGAGIVHNATFLADAITSNDKGQFIDKHKEAILSLNEASVQRSIASISQNTADSIPLEKDVNRFIAHAGGKINGDTYTNSLEALNLSYKKGFKLFELDILKTSDGVYVAAHDWRTWSERTGYKGTFPPNLSAFRKHPIKSYTPLDIIRINQWFSEHPDAILVTDKINDPIVFADVFIDRTRLMMELKTMDAVHQGLKANIRSVMPSQGVLNRMILGNKVQNLKKLGITDVALSRDLLKTQPLLLAQLKENDIHVYLYKLNAEEGKDEKYVVEYELNQAYGLYADDWSFEE